MALYSHIKGNIYLVGGETALGTGSFEQGEMAIGKEVKHTSKPLIIPS